MSRRLLDYDPWTGIYTYHHYDDETKMTYIEETQDAEPWLELNKRRQNDKDYSKKGIKESWWHVATIPTGVQYQWLREGINIYDKDHWPAVRRKLNDINWRHLRTTSGKI